VDDFPNKLGQILPRHHVLLHSPFLHKRRSYFLCTTASSCLVSSRRKPARGKSFTQKPSKLITNSPFDLHRPCETAKASNPTMTSCPSPIAGCRPAPLSTSDEDLNGECLKAAICGVHQIRKEAHLRLSAAIGALCTMPSLGARSSYLHYLSHAQE